MRIDWEKLDPLIIEHLPHMTCVEFVKKYASETIPRTIGKRAKKLGISPKKYYPTAEHKRKTGEGASKRLTGIQLQYIRDNLNKKSRKQISRDINVSIYLINKACVDMGLSIDEEKMKEFHKKGSAGHVKKATKAWQDKFKNDEAFRNKILKKRSEINKRLWQSEEYRLKVRNGIRRAYDDTDLRYRLSDIAKKRYKEDPKVREILFANRDFKNSKLNDIVAIKLESLGFSIEREFKLANYSFDFKVDNILLEVHGEYWHNLPNNVKNDRAKATILERYYPEYLLRVIWEREVKSIRCNERLLEILGKEIIPQKISLNKLQFVEDPPDNQRFLISYHYLGDTNRRKFVFGLLLWGETIAVAVFGQPVRQNTYPGKVLELVRLCRHPKFYNKNMLSYFLAKCEKELKGQCDALVSYADLRLHDGGIYRAANWDDCGLTANDYQYMSQDNIPMHKKTLYNRAVREGLREREYAEKYAFKKVNVGRKRKFIRKLI